MLSQSLSALHVSRPTLRAAFHVPKAYQCQKWDVEQYGEMNEENIEKLYAPLGYEVGAVYVKPGTVYPRHDHKADSIVHNMEGEFTINFDDQEVIIQPGEFFEFPLGVPHVERVEEEGARIEVASKETGLVLIFKAVKLGKRVMSLFGDRKE